MNDERTKTMIERCICYLCDRHYLCPKYDPNRHEDYGYSACEHYDDADDHSDEIEGGCSRWTE